MNGSLTGGHNSEVQGPTELIFNGAQEHRKKYQSSLWMWPVVGAVNDVGGDNVWKIYPLGK